MITQINKENTIIDLDSIYFKLRMYLYIKFFDDLKSLSYL